MPRSKVASIRVPGYRLHKPSGQAVVTLGGRDQYLGPHGSKESRSLYCKVIAEYVASKGTSSAPRRDELTMVELCALFMRHAKSYYARPDGKMGTEYGRLKECVRLIVKSYESTLVVDFGPIALRAVREQMIAKKWVRTQINAHVNKIRRIFRWGISEQIVPTDVGTALASLAPLKKGRSDAPESGRVRPVPDDAVELTLAKLNPIVADMVRIQRLTGCRPGELVIMRPVDIDRKQREWVYAPESHKTDYLDINRVVLIGPRAQKILEKYLARDESAYCFSPREVDAQRRAKQTEARKTPSSCGNRPGTNREKTPAKKPGERYTTKSYGRAVADAAKKAGVPIWRPHKLRHSFATETRKRFGLEAAQVSLGHRHARISETYAERDFLLAAKVAKELG